ncbi:hypothetical protein HanIR_Chr08g0382391 [Helianthus annuus]|nr:hypothetical protein HanIR_Chr08g0382391 [Helianthus annuus]
MGLTSLNPFISCASVPTFHWLLFNHQKSSFIIIFHLAMIHQPGLKPDPLPT